MEVGFLDDAKVNGFVDAAARRAPGMVPGVDTTTTVSRVTGKAPQTRADFSVARALGDLVGINAGIPGIGDLAHAAVNGVPAPATEADRKSIARALRDKPGQSRPNLTQVIS